MRPSLRARFWRAVLRKAVKERRLSLSELRLERGSRSLARLASLPVVLKGLRVERLKFAGLRAAWFRPEGAEPSKAVLYLHGGGYVSGSIDSYLMLAASMARALGRSLLLPEYRLAPEHPFPAALEDALAAWRGLLASGLAPGDLVVAGDSAGGGLALALVLSLRDAREPLPAAVVCVSPWADLAASGGSRVAKAAAESLLSPARLDEWALRYAGKAGLEDPLVSPLRADLGGLPPLLVQVGSEEILLDDSVDLAAKAGAAGVEARLSVWPGLFHAWPALGELLPESGLAFAEARDFILSVEARREARA